MELGAFSSSGRLHISHVKILALKSHHEVILLLKKDKWVSFQFHSF